NRNGHSTGYGRLLDCCCPQHIRRRPWTTRKREVVVSKIGPTSHHTGAGGLHLDHEAMLTQHALYRGISEKGHLLRAHETAHHDKHPPQKRRKTPRKGRPQMPCPNPPPPNQHKDCKHAAQTPPPPLRSHGCGAYCPPTTPHPAFR